MENVVIEHFRERVRRGEYAPALREVKSLPERLEGRLLEVGCGAGLTYLPGRLEVCGVDITPEMIRLFEKLYPDAHAIIGDAKALPFRRASFNVIVSNELLHHLVGSSVKKCKDNVKKAMGEMKRVLKSDGVLLIRELLVGSYLFSLIMFYFTLLCAKLGIEINLLDIHSRVITFFLTEKEFKKISSENGFEIEAELRDWIMFGKLRLGRDIEFLARLRC